MDSIQISKVHTNCKKFWDSELKHMIKSRKDAARFHRLWLKSDSPDPDVILELWNIYMERKKAVSQKIK